MFSGIVVSSMCAGVCASSSQPWRALITWCTTYIMCTHTFKGQAAACTGLKGLHCRFAAHCLLWGVFSALRCTALHCITLPGGTAGGSMSAALHPHTFVLRLLSPISTTLAHCICIPSVLCPSHLHSPSAPHHESKAVRISVPAAPELLSWGVPAATLGRPHLAVVSCRVAKRHASPFTDCRGLCGLPD